MANDTLKKVRRLRSKGKKNLIMINERLNSLAWELSTDNSAVNDPNITKAIKTMDEALETLQVAMVLLNTVAFDPDMMAQAHAASAKPARKSAFGKKPVASKAVPSMDGAS